MTNVSLTTLEDLGWKPYWDYRGHHPVEEGDLIRMTPSETIRLYWIANPVQEEDGKWYGNAIYMYEPIPSLVGGVYKISDILIDTILFGGEEEDSLQGKVEEFAFWKKDIGIDAIQDYQTNKTGMIGGDAGDKYDSILSAQNDGLKYYYSFENTSILLPNFSEESTAPLLKSKSMPVSGGKHKNSSSLNDGFMTIERMNFEEEFTINTRFYLDIEEDFLLIQNSEALRIHYDASNRVFQISFSPYIGNKKLFQLEYPAFRVHFWYDFAISYKDGMLSTVINGVEIEQFHPSSTIGGCQRTSVDFTNIEKATVFSGSGVGLGHSRFWGRWGHNYGLAYFVPTTTDSESSAMMSKMASGQFNSSFEGKANAMALIYDKENSKLAGMSLNISETASPSVTITDAVENTILINLPTRANVYLSNRNCTWTFAEEPGVDQFTVTEAENEIYSQSMSSIHNGSSIPNLLVPGMPILLELKVKDIIVEQENVFPKLTIFPGTRVKIVKKEMIPPHLTDAVSELVHTNTLPIGDSVSISGDPDEIIVAINKDTGRAYGAKNKAGWNMGIGLQGTNSVIYNLYISSQGSSPSTALFEFKRLKNW
jgi:hypothetical protein